MAEVEVTYATAGLYARIVDRRPGDGDPGEIARVAHSLLPGWMRQPGPE